MLAYSSQHLRGILNRVKNIAMVGVSGDPVRPGHIVAKYLNSKGYGIFVVNPGLAGQEIFGQTAVASLDELKDKKIDMVDIFRRADHAALAKAAVRIGAKVFWLQLGLVSEDAAAIAEAAGLTVVMDRCPKIELGRLVGENGWLGINSGVISSKPPSYVGPQK